MNLIVCSTFTFNFDLNNMRQSVLLVTIVSSILLGGCPLDNRPGPWYSDKRVIKNSSSYKVQLRQFFGSHTMDSRLIVGDSIIFSVNCQNYLDGASCVDSNTGAVVYSTSYSHNFALEDSAHIIFGGEKILRDTRAWENLDNCLERSILTLGVGL